MLIGRKAILTSLRYILSIKINLEPYNYNFKSKFVLFVDEI
jgi:hypothetical protein